MATTYTNNFCSMLDKQLDGYVLNNHNPLYDQLGTFNQLWVQLLDELRF